MKPCEIPTLDGCMDLLLDSFIPIGIGEMGTLGLVVIPVLYVLDIFGYSVAKKGGNGTLAIDRVIHDFTSCKHQLEWICFFFQAPVVFQ